jgi:hypothetical protein
MSLLQAKSWLGLMSYFLATEDMLLPNCSASSTIALFSSGRHLLLRWTPVITLMELIVLLLLNYGHKSRRMTITYLEVYQFPVQLGATSILILREVYGGTGMFPLETDMALSRQFS